MKVLLTFLISLLMVGAYFDSNSLVFDSKIVGGTEVLPGEVSFMVSIRFRSHPLFHMCGGFIITFYHVLTAAHCVYPSRLYVQKGPNIKLGVVIGSVNVYLGGTWYDVDNINTGASYCPARSPSIGDIAIATLVDRVVLTKFVSMVRMSMAPVPPGSLGFIAGWGYMNLVEPKERGILSKTLKVIAVKVAYTERCEDMYQTNEIDKDSICAYSVNKHGTPTLGDSGGPLIVNDTVVGIYIHGLSNEAGVRFIVVGLREYEELIEEQQRLEIIREVSERQNPSPIKSRDPRPLNVLTN